MVTVLLVVQDEREHSVSVFVSVHSSVTVIVVGFSVTVTPGGIISGGGVIIGLTGQGSMTVIVLELVIVVRTVGMKVTVVGDGPIGIITVGEYVSTQVFEQHSVTVWVTVQTSSQVRMKSGG